MSKEKQMIEELAAFLWKNTLIHTEDLCHDVAETVITDGYRKQSEDVPDTNVVCKSEWISVDERLPDEKQKVLLYSPADGIQIGHRLDEVGRFYVSKAYPERPTHWMPLPEPPKGE